MMIQNVLEFLQKTAVVTEPSSDDAAEASTDSSAESAADTTTEEASTEAAEEDASGTDAQYVV